MLWNGFVQQIELPVRRIVDQKNADSIYKIAPVFSGF